MLTNVLELPDRTHDNFIGALGSQERNREITQLPRFLTPWRCQRQ